MAILTAEAQVWAKTRNAPHAGSLCVHLQNGGVVHSTQTRQTVHRHVVQVYEMGVWWGEGSVQEALLQMCSQWLCCVVSYVLGCAWSYVSVICIQILEADLRKMASNMWWRSHVQSLKASFLAPIPCLTSTASLCPLTEWQGVEVKIYTYEMRDSIKNVINQLLSQKAFMLTDIMTNKYMPKIQTAVFQTSLCA